MDESVNPLELLANASRTLFSSLTYDQTLAALAKLVVPALSEWCVVDVLEHGNLRRIHVAHVLPEMEALAQEIDRRYPPVYDPAVGPGKAVRTLAPEVLNEIPDSLVRQAAKDEEHYRLLKQFDLAALLSVPMVADGKAVGVISLIRNSREGPFRPEEIELALELAVRAAIAVHNAQVTLELRLQTERLQSSELRLRLAQQAGRIGTWEIELASGNVIWSDDLYEITGLDPSVTPNFSYFMNHIHPEDQAAVNERMQEQLSGSGSDIGFEYRMIGADGQTRWIATRGRILRNDRGHPVRMVGVIMDITERKLVEAALLESERIAVAGRLAATLAHEINNPLAAITNLVYLARTAPAQAQSRQYLDVAEQELRRVSQVATQTLRYYRPEPSGAECKLSDIVESAMPILRQKLDAKRIEFVTDIRDNTSFEGKEAECRQIVLNLLTNAIEAVDSNGCIRIRGYTRNGFVRIIVSDNGGGIPAHIRSRLFQPFVTSKGSEGTGLGLWITKSLVEKNGGTVRVRSSQGLRRGTSFQLVLPRKKAREQLSTPDTQSAAVSL